MLVSHNQKKWKARRQWFKKFKETGSVQINKWLGAQSRFKEKEKTKAMLQWYAWTLHICRQKDNIEVETMVEKN